MTRGKKAVAAFLAELVFVGLVALALVRLGGLQGDALSETPGIGLIPRLPDTAFYLLTAAAAAVLAAGLILALVALIREKRGPARAKEPDALRAWHVLAFVIVGVAMTLLIAGTILALLMQPPERSGAEAGLVEKEQRIEEEPESPEQPEPEPRASDSETRATAAGRYILVASLVVALALTVVLIVRLAKSRLAPAAEGRDALARLRADLKEAAEEGIEAVLREEDPRKAVVACYARMEQVFRAHGYPRAPHLTPMEYMMATLRAIFAAGAATAEVAGPEATGLARAVAGAAEAGAAGAAEAGAAGTTGAAAPGAQALLRLTELYELARFSEHTIHPRDKDAAISCLEQIRGSIPLREAGT